MTVLRVTGLTAATAEQPLLERIDLALGSGDALTVLGESGAGKTTLGLALLGETGRDVRLTGQVFLGGVELLGADDTGRRRARAGRIAHLPQHPGSVLDPVRRVGRVLDELAALVHRDRRARLAAIRRACDVARFDPVLLRRFPHQLSGGQQQRAGLTQALVTEPSVLVLDEPTTGLDPTTAAELAARLGALRSAGTAIVLLTHDHDTARTLGGAAMILESGRIARQGTTAEILGPRPVRRPRPDRDPGAPRLALRGVSVDSPAGHPILREVELRAAAGELLAIVGPSGSGKTTLGRFAAGLLRGRARGAVLVDGQPLPTRAGRRSLAQRRAVQYVHQDPRSTFRPHRPVLDQVARAAVLLHRIPPDRATADAAALLDRLGVPLAAARRRPGTLSGGQLQRAAVARALSVRPSVLICDEVTSALDAARRDELIEVIAAVRRDHGTTVLLISHDHALVDQVADRVLTIDGGLAAPR